MSNETFVMGDTEVRMTGRVAQKPAPGGKILTLVEVTPISDYDGTWKKWVNPTTLFSIVTPSEKK